MPTISISHEIAGVLTDATSVELATADAAYGVKRNDTDAVVVASGVAMDHLDTGLYSHTFDDDDLDLTYTYSLKIVYGGVTSYTTGTIVGASTPSAALHLTAGTMVDRIEAAYGWSDPTEAQSAQALNDLNDGYRRFLRGEHFTDEGRLVYYAWNWLRPLAQLSIGGAVTGIATGVADTDLITATTSIFDPSMVGLSITVADVDSFDIAGYTSGTVVSVDDGDDFAGKAVSVPSKGIYDLPADFGGLLGAFLYQHSGSDRPAIEERPPEWIQAQWRKDKVLGPPRYYALVPAAFVAATGQRWQAWLYPLPDEARVLRYRYRVLANALTDDPAVYPLGGPDASDAIMEAGLAAMERSRNVLNGPHEQEYHKHMRALVALDSAAYAAGDAPEALDMGVEV